jgi:hypothetical protein
VSHFFVLLIKVVQEGFVCKRFNNHASISPLMGQIPILSWTKHRADTSRSTPCDGSTVVSWKAPKDGVDYQFVVGGVAALLHLAFCSTVGFHSLAQ